MDVMDDDAPATKADLREMGRTLKSEMLQAMEGMLAGLLNGQDGLRAGQDELRAGQDELRAGQDKLRAGQDELRAEIRSTRRDLALEIVKTNARIDRLEIDLRAEMTGRASMLVEKIDGFMSKTEKVDRAQIIADWRIKELEKRVSAVEPRPS